MKKGINLAFGTRQVDKVFQKALATSIVFFISVVVISLGLIAYRLILKANFDSLEAKEQQLNQQLLSYVEKRDKFIETKSRLSDIRSIIAKRSPTTVRIDTMTSFVPTSATIKGLSGDEEEMDLRLESEDLLSLNDLVEQKLVEVSEDKQKGIKKIDMHSFGLNASSRLYTATFTVTFD